MNCIGVGFDGRKFIFARFVPSSKKNVINVSKVNIARNLCLNIEFIYEIKDFQSGLKRLALILKQQDKRELNKKNLLEVINTKSKFVRKSILNTYKEIEFNLNDFNGSDRVRTLYNEWNKVLESCMEKMMKQLTLQR